MTTKKRFNLDFSLVKDVMVDGKFNRSICVVAIPIVKTLTESFKMYKTSPYEVDQINDFLNIPLSDITFGTNRRIQGWILTMDQYSSLILNTQISASLFDIRLIPSEVFNFLIFSHTSGNNDPDVENQKYTHVSSSSSSSSLLNMKRLHSLSSFNRLYPYQQKGVEFVLTRKGRAMIADDMGLGKTFQAITLIDYISKVDSSANRVLVIVPASLRVNWIRECRELLVNLSSPNRSQPEPRLVLLNKYSDVTQIPIPILAQYYQTLKAQTKRGSRSKKGEKKHQKPRKRVANEKSTATTTLHTNLLITVVSYSLFTSTKMEMFRKSYQPHMMICDESHYIKSSDSIRCKSVYKMVRDMYRRRGIDRSYLVLLTGTPSSLTKDMYTQLRMINPGLFNKFSRFFKNLRSDGSENGCLYFGERYCEPEEVHLYGGRKVRAFKGTARSWELNVLIQNMCIRRIKKKVLRDLPELCRYRVSIDKLSPSKARYFNQQMKLIESLREKEGKRKAESAMTRLVLETSVLKHKCVCTYLKQYIQTIMLPKDKCLIFAHHIAMIDKILNMVKLLDVEFIHIDGRTPHTERQQLVDQFQTNPKTRIAILGITAAGTGLNLYAANVVLFAELTWNQKLALQAECRSHRIGQTQHVTVKYLILEGSTDETMWHTLNKKIKNTAAILDNEDEKLNAERVAYDTGVICDNNSTTTTTTDAPTGMDIRTTVSTVKSTTKLDSTHLGEPKKRMVTQLNYILKRKKHKTDIY